MQITGSNGESYIRFETIKKGKEVYFRVQIKNEFDDRWFDIVKVETLTQLQKEIGLAIEVMKDGKHGTI